LTIGEDNFKADSERFAYTQDGINLQAATMRDLGSTAPNDMRRNIQTALGNEAAAIHVSQEILKLSEFPISLYLMEKGFTLTTTCRTRLNFLSGREPPTIEVVTDFNHLRDGSNNQII
jgi:hypothetical protein